MAAIQLADQVDAQKVFADIAKNIVGTSIDDTVTKDSAIEKLTDQSLLVDVLKNTFVKESALKNLTDQSALEDVAKNAKSWLLRLVAAEKLTDKSLAQEVFADIAKNADMETRMRAANNLSDKAVAQEVRDDFNSAVQLMGDRGIGFKVIK